MSSGRPCVAVIGLGLMGGCLARDLSALGWRVVAADRDPAALDAAIADGVVDEGFEAGGVAGGVLESVDVVVLATPVPAARELLPWLASVAPAGAVLTDLGSTKRSVLAAAGEAGLAARFVGGHPMAGDHRSGWGEARTGLFAGARVWLCHAGAEPRAVQRVAMLWSAVGASPREIDAAEHDQLVTWSSHLPQLMASTLGVVLGLANVGPSELGPGGRDATRLARSDAGLWAGIVMDNADLLVPCLEAFTAGLQDLRDRVEQGREEEVRALLEAGRAWAARPSHGPMTAAHDDAPGHRPARGVAGRDSSR